MKKGVITMLALLLLASCGGTDNNQKQVTSEVDSQQIEKSLDGVRQQQFTGSIQDNAISMGNGVVQVFPVVDEQVSQTGTLDIGESVDF